MIRIISIGRKLHIGGGIGAIFFLYFCPVLAAQPPISPEEGYGEKQTRIIVRFADHMGYGLLDRLYQSPGGFELVSPDGSLAELNSKHRIQQITRVFNIQTSGTNQTIPDFRNSISNHADIIQHEHQEFKLFKQHVEKIKHKYVKRNQRTQDDIEIPNLLNVFSIEFLSAYSPEEICSDLKRQSYVEYAVPAELAELHYDPNDPYYGSSGSWGQSYDDLYALKEIKLNCAPMWDITKGDGTTVAVIDTGVDLLHEDIADNLWVNTDEIPANGLDDDHNGYVDDVYGYDFSDEDPDPSDYNGHGSHCAGIIGASTNSTGIIGVSPRTKIMALKGFPNAYDDILAEAIRYAADNGADVLSNSWGPRNRTPSDPVIEDAIDYAHALGCVIVFSAGNKQDDVQYYSPANHPNTIAVAATDHNDKRASFTNYGHLVDVSAPGVEILSLRAENTDMYEGSTGYTSGQRFVPAFDSYARYYRASGTSMSCPYVSGLAAQVISRYPTYSNDMVAGQIIGSADPIDGLNPGYAGLLGSGRINAYKALTMAPTPCITFLSYQIDDSLSGNNPNGSLEPGETVDLTVSLRNVWADLQNTVVTLSTTDPLVTISQATSSYGSIACGQIRDNAASPFRLTFSNEGNVGHAITLTLTISGDGYSHSLTFVCYSSIGNLQGWPMTSDTWKISNSPIVLDIDNDGKDEFIVGLNNALNIFNEDRSNCPHWPTTIGSDFMFRTYAVGDIDGDGDSEVIGLAQKQAGVTQGNVYAWHFESGLPVQGFPKNLGSAQNCGMALGNLDNNSNDMEIVVSSTYSSSNSKVYVIQGDGTDLAGWPVSLPETASKSGVAVGDIDNKPGNEIVVSTGKLPGFDYLPSPIYVFRSNGTAMSGWPKKTDGYLCNPVLANLDDTEDLEIIVGSVTEAHNGTLYAWKYNGSNVAGWPKSYNTYDVSVGDVNGDGDIEIFSGCRSTGRLRVFKKNGTLLWQRSSSVSSTFSFTDINDDGKDDILFQAFPDLVAYDYAGNVIAGFPVKLDGSSYSQPAICDLDGDGDIEIITYSYYSPRSIYVFDLKSHLPNRRQWPMYCRDPELTNRYPLIYAGNITDDWIVDLCDIEKLVTLWLEGNCNNIFGDESDWCYGADINKSGKVNLSDFQFISDDWLRGT